MKVIIYLALVFNGCLCQTLDDLRNLVNNLPNATLYLPFSKQFGLNDASANEYPGNYTSTRVTFATGPSGAADTAIEMGGTGAGKYVIVGDYDDLNFQENGGTSWTISILVKMKTFSGPITEYDYIDPTTAGYRAHLWMWNATDKLWFNSAAGAGSMEDCAMANTWQFVAVVYDHSLTQFRTYCDSTFGTPMNLQPLHTPRLLIGARVSPSTQTGCDGCQYACLGIYRTALTSTQLQQVRQQCLLWNQVVTCSPGCPQDTCWPDLSQPKGYRCTTCTAGYTGIQCDRN